MELIDALARAGQILDEERAAPTVRYELKRPEGLIAGSSASLALTVTETAKMIELVGSGSMQVLEDPRQYVFTSGNYNLLGAVQSRMARETRPAFISSLLVRLTSTVSPAYRSGYSSGRCCWNQFVSELPLVVEFCARNGATQLFLTRSPNPS
jgi:hypothetical protein